MTIKNSGLAAGGRYQIFTEDGIPSVRTIGENEILITPEGTISFLTRCGYQVIGPEVADA